MYEYKCVKRRWRVEDTENMLNVLSIKGWEVVCSYGDFNDYIILKRKLKGGQS